MSVSTFLKLSRYHVDITTSTGGTGPAQLWPQADAPNGLLYCIRYTWTDALTGAIIALYPSADTNQYVFIDTAGLGVANKHIFPAHSQVTETGTALTGAAYEHLLIPCANEPWTIGVQSAGATKTLAFDVFIGEL